MYRHILIPTDGSELAEQAVTHGLSLAKSVGAKVTVIIVEELIWLGAPSLAEYGALEELANYPADQELPCERVKSRGRCGQAGRCALQNNSVERTRNLIKPSLQRARIEVAISSSWQRTGTWGLSAVLLGSVTNKVLTHTKIPALVCH